MNTLSKAIIAEILCNEFHLSKPDAKKMVGIFFETLKGTLENGEFVKLSGFGNFILRDKSQRPGRNPKTGQEIPVEARRVVTFRPGLKLKKRIEAMSAEK